MFETLGKHSIFDYSPIPMITQELEQLIEGQAESPNLDFKTDMSWNDESFAKDFLAMSNMRDGGTIIIGVEEKGAAFIPVGVSAANLSSYMIDKMRAQLASFCDPSPEFRVHTPQDSTGKTFVVIRISPFRDLPLLSRKSIPKVIIANALYYRNTNKGVESAPISNPHDLRDLIELAARNLIRRRTELGWELPTGMETIFDRDLTSLPGDEPLTGIKAGSYWEVEFRPTTDMQVETLKNLEERIQKATVRLNWPFPYFSISRQGAEGLNYGDGYIDGFVNHAYLHEFWRFYTSGHFLLYRKLQDDDIQIATAPLAGAYVSYLNSIIHFISEVVEFFSRMTAGGLYASGGRLSMTLQNVRDRTLFIDNPALTPFMYERRTSAPVIRLFADVTGETLLTEPMVYSQKMILRLLGSFGFEAPPDVIERFQRHYLSKQ